MNTVIKAIFLPVMLIVIFVIQIILWLMDLYNWVYYGWGSKR